MAAEIKQDSAHKGPALFVFVEARALSDEHDSGVRRALARDRIRTALVESALSARPDRLMDEIQAGHCSVLARQASPCSLCL